MCEEIGAASRKITPPEEQRARWTAIVFCTKELFGAANYSLIAPVLLERLEAYRHEGCPVGSFLQAVISNNLRDAIGNADEYNRATLFHLIAWMHNEFPSPLWGSAEKYVAHLERKHLERNKHEENGSEVAGGGVDHSYGIPGI
jgi:hypothetical protein